MPIYEYICKECSGEFELLVRGGESAVCPGCSSDRLEKQFSVTAAPQNSGGSLPITSPAPMNCSAPRCCGGGCQTD